MRIREFTIAVLVMLATVAGSVGIASASAHDVRLARCEHAIQGAIRSGVDVLGGQSTPAIRRYCAHLTRRETRRAERFTVRYTRLVLNEP